MSQATFDFSGHKALVTGATKGIGREIALRLAEAGCQIAATGRDQAELELLADHIRGLGRRCEILSADLASIDSTVRMAEHLAGAMRPLDILINNAGVSFPEGIVDLDIDHWDTTMDVNLRAPAIVSKIVSRDMIAQKNGVIINVSSQSGVVGLERHAAYCASKFGLNGLTKVMALELGPYGVRVNAVAPTVVLTPMGEKVWGDPARSQPMLAKIPLGRFAQLPDVVDAVLFLASDAAAMVNGEVFVIDGGYTAR